MKDSETRPTGRFFWNIHAVQLFRKVDRVSFWRVENFRFVRIHIASRLWQEICVFFPSFHLVFIFTEIFHVHAEKTDFVRPKIIAVSHLHCCFSRETQPSHLLRRIFAFQNGHIRYAPCTEVLSGQILNFPGALTQLIRRSQAMFYYIKNIIITAFFFFDITMRSGESFHFVILYTCRVRTFATEWENDETSGNRPHPHTMDVLGLLTVACAFEVFACHCCLRKGFRMNRRKKIRGKSDWIWGKCGKSRWVIGWPSECVWTNENCVFRLRNWSCERNRKCRSVDALFGENREISI